MKYLLVAGLVGALSLLPACAALDSAVPVVEQVAPVVDELAPEGSQVDRAAKTLAELTKQYQDLKQRHDELRRRSDLDGDGKISGVYEYTTYGNGILALLFLAYQRMERRKRKAAETKDS